MDYNKKFMNLMDGINQIAQGKGFKNGVDWASYTSKSGKISKEDYGKYRTCHNLRNSMAHGGAECIEINSEIYQRAEKFYSAIANEKQNQKKTLKEIILPEGTFRKTYVEKIQRVDDDGNVLNFEFSIVHEQNMIDDGSNVDKEFSYKDGSCKDDVKKGVLGTGFFIHILEAPQYDVAREKPHEFHIIPNPSGEDHICWDREIDSFQDAKAVMYNWVDNYVALLPKERRDTMESLPATQMLENIKKREYDTKSNEIAYGTKKKKGLLGRIFGW